MTFAYGCCVGSWDKFTRYVVPRVPAESPLFTTPGNIGSRVFGIARAYNAILDIFPVYDGALEGLILVHDDLEMIDPSTEDKVRSEFADPTVGLVGVAGGGGASLYWWEHNPVGHQLTDVMSIDFGSRTGNVELIEGSFMALSPRVARAVSFDTRFTGFHGYDEFAAQVRALGLRVVVADIDTHHHNPMGYRSEESAAECRRANELYREKWSLT